MTESSPPTGAAPDPGPLRAELHARPVSGEKPSVYRMQVELAGVYIETEEALSKGAIVSLHITLPRENKELKTVGRVAYQLDADAAAALARRPGVGLELLDVWGRDAAASVEGALQAARAEPDPAVGSDILAGARVLIVDDDSSYRERAAEGMRQAGSTVLTARNGMEGLSTALRELPDLIISDVTMPGLDGWQLLRLLRTKNSLRNTPVIFLTDLREETDRIRGYRLGVDDYLGKPFTPEELRARARRAVERVNASLNAGGLRGKLSEVPLSTLLSLTELERKTGLIELAKTDGERATLYLRNGKVLRIALDEEHEALGGIDRFFHVLDWESGHFELSSAEVDEPDTLDLRTTFVLLEHARRRDEAAD